MSTIAVRPFAAVAGTLAAASVAFRGAAENLDTLSTPFARSVLASVLNGTSLAMTEQVLLAALGSPTGGAKGKPLTVSGIARRENNVKGGAAIYQVWKAVQIIADNLDSDAYVIAPGTDDANPDGVPGAAAIRPAVVAFVLGDDGAVATLRGKAGLEATVAGMMSDHAKAIAATVSAPEASNVIAPDAANDDAGEGNVTPAGRMSLTDRANAFLLAWTEASDAEREAAAEAVAAMMAGLDAYFIVTPDAEAVAA